jgi:hypothetical protein
MGKGRVLDFSVTRALAIAASLGACATPRSSDGPPRVIIVAVPQPRAADRPAAPATPTCEIVPVEPARIVGDLWLMSVRQPDQIPPEPGDTVAQRPNASLDVWDLATGERTRTFDLAAPLPRASTAPTFSWTDGGRLIVAAPEVDQRVRASILDLRGSDAREALGADVSFPTDVAVSKDATRGAIIGKHDELAVFELPSGS